jgi:hypothetical protein
VRISVVTFLRSVVQLWVSFSVFAALTFAMTGRVSAEAQPASESDQLIWGARGCFLEAGWSESDCAALMWVVMKQAAIAKRPWYEVMRAYSALSAPLPRAREISAYPWGDVPGKSESFNQRWARLRELVQALAEGHHRDPCPHAMHWGGHMDHPQGRMIPARCVVKTANIFYALKRR